MLLVSHDRVFLDRVVTSTLAFEGGGRVQEYVGGYEDYLRQRDQERGAPPKPAHDEGRPLHGGKGAAIRGRTVAKAASERKAARTASLAPPASPKPQRGEGGPKPPRGEGGRKLSYKEKRELDALPEKIAALEAEQAQLRDEAASAEFYKSPADRIKTVLARLESVQQDLDTVLERWVELDGFKA